MVGIDVKRNMVVAMMIAGAIAGLAGADSGFRGFKGNGYSDEIRFYILNLYVRLMVLTGIAVALTA